METKIVTSKRKRSRDGCQNCKKTRIKCDRTKPICNVCLRRGVECDYSQKITWVTVENNDSHSRHPSFKGAKAENVIVSLDLPVRPEDEVDEAVTTNPDDPMISTTEEYNQINTQEPFDIIHLEQKFFKFVKVLNPDIAKVFQTKDSYLIYQHYLTITCSSLDPLHGSGPENISQKFFLPVAVNDPAILHGILAISSSQLSNTNPSFKELSLVHKSLAYKHLYSQISTPKKAISLEALSAIICQLSIELIQSGVKNWRVHINALRRIVNQRKEQMYSQEDQTTWFIYLRVARYDNFASLTTGDDPLFKSIAKEIPNLTSYHPTIQNIDCIFGCPSDVLFFCAELTHISKMICQGGSLRDLGYTEDALRLRQFEILANGYHLSLTDDWSCVQNMWCSAMGIHFYHCLEDKNHPEYSKIHIANIFKALRVFIELDSFFCANLMWPILKVATVINNTNERDYLILCLDIFYKKTGIGAFTQLQSLMKEIWELVDNGHYTKPSDWWKYQQSRDTWDLYLA